MKPATAAAVFAVLVSAMNWYYTRSGATATSSYQVTLAGSALVSLFSLAALFFLGRAIYRTVRRFLADGIRVPEGSRFVEWWPCFFLFPILIQYSGGTTYSKNDGFDIVTKWGYGSEAGIVVICLSVAVIALFQIYAGLSRYDEEREAQQGAAAKP